MLATCKRAYIGTSDSPRKTIKLCQSPQSVINNAIDNGESVIDLSYMGIEDLPEKEIGDLKNLVHYSSSQQKLGSSLELSGQSNLIVRLTPSLWTLTNLVVLNMYNNRISEIPTEIKSLVNLKVLILGRNELRVLPMEILKLPELKRLSLNCNPLIQSLGKEKHITVAMRGPPTLMQIAAKECWLKSNVLNACKLPRTLSMWMTKEKRHCSNCDCLYSGQVETMIKWQSFLDNASVPFLYHFCSKRCRDESL